MNINIEYNKKVYRINSNHGKSISIPMNFNSNNNPKFYDESNPIKEPYTSNDVKYNINNNASCNVPIIKFNIHCSGTHTETGAHIFKGSKTIGELPNLNFIPSRLITIKPQKQSNENYHVTYDSTDQIITKQILIKSLDAYNDFIECIIIRTLPNSENKLKLNYNEHNHPFLSNDAIYYLKEKAVKHIIIDTPSIDRSDDGGQLKNHKIFFSDNDNSINKNTVTELAFIPDSCIDGRYFVCIGYPKFQLDAAPSNPVIYKVI
tara:strand:- start:1020 stop:1805 length:786 start_codon:yes stop_codon:yes gene_type:complete